MDVRRLLSFEWPCLCGALLDRDVWLRLILMQIVGKVRLISFWDIHRAWLVWAHDGVTWPMSAKDLICQGLH